ncbi:MAG: hypothetical protein DWP97_14470 [Calditrichaeota bacterium]|nr:MAG: hypothetical protein DWP97_14470 [Calditrichota bacterium]
MMLRNFSIAIFIFLIFITSLSAKITKTFVGHDIPSVVPVASHYLMGKSDSLLLNGKLLSVGKDYNFIPQLKQFELLLTDFSQYDTLIVKYTPAPSWLKLSYGNTLPDINNRSISPGEPLDLSRITGGDKNTSNIDISGSKSFRVSSATAQSSSFKQTLDLQIAGELSDSLTIKGSISDRGYDPVYGTANSSLNELDKIQLELKSKRFSMQLGDIVSKPSVLTGSSYQKKISGVHTAYHSDNYSIDAIAARPKGTFTNVIITGQDNLQGPYQITQSQRNAPIVPGSESIYLNGELLVAGAENDYTVDYPLGQITFTSQQPIDSRSRISVDFEPFETEYKKEYYSTESHIFLNDSLWNVSFGWTREGDSKSERLLNPFSEEELLFLEQFGDSADTYYISSVKEDSSGLYLLIIDSLPDSVYQYVGGDSGLYSISFSYVGVGNGSYIFEGLEVYTYVGDNQGDYLPVKILKAPSRQDYLTTSVGYGNVKTGIAKIGVSKSIYDRNLLSDKNEKNNSGQLLVAEIFKPYRKDDYLSASFKQTDKQFIKRNRQTNSDLYFRMLYPDKNPQKNDEKIINATVSHRITSHLAIFNDLNYLTYGDNFRSTNESIRTDINPLKKLSISMGYTTVNAKLDSIETEEGKSEIVEAKLQYDVTPTLSTKVSYENLSREKNYYQIDNKITSDKLNIRLGTKKHNIDYEYYAEDSVEYQFQRTTIRNRVNVSSEKSFSEFSYKSNFGYQSVKVDSQITNSFLTRLKLDYRNRANQLTIRTTYHISRESKQSRGLRYIKVNQGEGNYVLEDSVYIYQENGDYILLDELLSGSSDVKHGEKLFTLSKDWKKAKFLFDSRITEDLFANDKRSFSWVVPFYSNTDKSYLLYNRKYLSSLSLFPISSGYLFNLDAASSYQIRNITAVDRVKENNELKLLLRQVYKNLFFDESVKLFEEKSDSYYSINGDVNGYELSSKISMLASQNRYGFELLYRDAELKNSGSAQILSFIITSSVRILSGSELRSSFEYYSSKAQADDLLNSYLLTGNKIGKSGMLWSLILQNRIKNSFRLNVRVTGRDVQDRDSRISARTEFVAGF